MYVHLLLATLVSLFCPTLSQPYDWYRLDEHEYLVSELVNQGYGEEPWHDARAWCMSQGADLASLNSWNQTDFIQKIIDRQWRYDTFWIGYNRIYKDSFQWSDGSESDYESWDPDDKPDPDDADNAVAYLSLRGSGLWSASHVGWYRGFICKRLANDTEPKTDAPTPKIAGFCPQSYFAVGNKCFQLNPIYRSSDGVTWQEADDRCREGPGYFPSLATIHSDLETYAIASRMLQPILPMWIGLHRYNEDTDHFRWTDNSPLDYENWQYGWPSFYDDRYGIVNYGENALWTNSVGTSLYGYICQTYKDPNALITTPPPPPHVCPDGYTAYWYACYKYFPSVATYNDAESLCKEEGTTLVTIHEMAENTALRFLLVSNTIPKVWIGLDDRDSDLEYTWSDASYMTFSNWDYGEPERKPGGGCVSYDDTGHWSDTPCLNTLPFVCKKSTVPPMTTPTHIEGSCPDNFHEHWVPMGSYCYLFMMESADRETWVGAQEKCLEHGAILAPSDHRTINDMIYSEVEDRGYVWIGMHRHKHEDRFVWVDGSPVQFTFWDIGYPDAPDSSRDCVVMETGSDGRWLTSDCLERTYSYVCRTEKGPVPTTPVDTKGFCPSEEWHTRGSHCYLFRPNDGYTWQEANEQCEDSGIPGVASLVTLADLQENRFIEAMTHELNMLPMHRPYWVGMQRIGMSDLYSWVDGSDMDFKNWALSHPDANRACVEMHTEDGKWYTADCENLRGYICKTQKLLTDPNISEDEGDDSGLSAAVMTGIVIGCLAGVVILGTLIGLALLKGRSRRERKEQIIVYDNNDENVEFH